MMGSVLANPLSPQAISAPLFCSKGAGQSWDTDRSLCVMRVWGIQCPFYVITINLW